MSPDRIESGTFINYKLKLRGVPMKWMSLIKEWVPGKYFVDFQMKGPYKIWHHKHSFIQLKNGVLMEDKVLYELPFSWISDFLIGWWIKKDVSKIFNYRTEVLKNIIGPAISHQSKDDSADDQASRKNIDLPLPKNDSNLIH